MELTRPPLTFSLVSEQVFQNPQVNFLVSVVVVVRLQLVGGAAIERAEFWKRKPDQ
jgi:hypothetical protein